MIKLDHDEPKLGQCEVVSTAAVVPRTSHRADLWARIDVRDNRVFRFRIEVRREVDQPVEVRDAVTSFHGEDLRRLEVELCRQAVHIGCFERHDRPPIGSGL